MKMTSWNARTLMLAVATVLLLPAAAKAADLFTPPVFVAAGDDLGCQIVNVGSKDRQVRIRVWNHFPAVVNDTGNFILGPGMVGSTGFGGSLLGYCQFTVKGQAGQFRAAAKVSTALGSEFVSVPAR